MFKYSVKKDATVLVGQRWLYQKHQTSPLIFNMIETTGFSLIRHAQFRKTFSSISSYTCQLNV